MGQYLQHIFMISNNCIPHTRQIDIVDPNKELILGLCLKTSSLLNGLCALDILYRGNTVTIKRDTSFVFEFERCPFNGGGNMPMNIEINDEDSTILLHFKGKKSL